MAVPKISIKVVNGRIIASGGGLADRDMGPVLNNTIKSAMVVSGRLILSLSDGTSADAGPISVVSISNISPTGLVSLSDGTSYQLSLPVVKSITAVSASGVVSLSDGSTQQLTLPTGPAGTPAPIYAALANSDFNVLVSGTTQLGTPPTGAAGAVFTVSGGDVYYTLTGSAPGTSSPALADTTQVQIDPLVDAQAFRCIVKAGVPRLVGYWLRRTN